MRNIFFVKVFLCMALFLGYSNIWGMERHVRDVPEGQKQVGKIQDSPSLKAARDFLEAFKSKQQPPQQQKSQPLLDPKTQPPQQQKIVIAQPSDITAKTNAQNFKVITELISGGFSRKRAEEIVSGKALGEDKKPLTVADALSIVRESDSPVYKGGWTTSPMYKPDVPPPLKPVEIPNSAVKPAALVVQQKSKSFLQKNKYALGAGIGAGVGLIALGGILAIILGITLDQDSESESQPAAPAVGPIGPIVGPDVFPPDVFPPDVVTDVTTPGVVTDVVTSDKEKSDTDGGILPPSIYPEKTEEQNESKNNEQIIESIANFYASIEERFKQALKESSYFDKIFKISGEISIAESEKIKTSIEYDLSTEAAGDLGTAFTPFLVKMLPLAINGVALNIDAIKELLPDGPAKELFTVMLQPSAAFIFMIKTILLINTTLRDESKKDTDKINFIIDEAMRLYSRLILTPKQDPTPDVIISKMPEAFRKIIGEMSLKMFGDLVYNVSDPENTVLIKRMGELQKLRDYTQITIFIKKEIIPLIKGKLTYKEQQLLLYSMEKYLADSPPKTGRDLWNHLDEFNLILTDVKKGLGKAKVDKNTVAKITALIGKVKDVRAGTKKITVLTKKPELEISTEVYSKQVSFNNVLKILFKNFSKIYYEKFQGDKNYAPDNFLLGKQATKYALQALFFRSLQDMLNANKALVNVKGTVALKMANGKKLTINPDQEFTKMCNDAGLNFVNAQTVLQDVVAKIKNDPKNITLQESYESALGSIQKASHDFFERQVEFRCKFAGFLPVKQGDGSTQTATELIQKRLKTLRKNSKHVDVIIASEYKPFGNALGFAPALLGIKSK